MIIAISKVMEERIVCESLSDVQGSGSLIIAQALQTGDHPVTRLPCLPSRFRWPNRTLPKGHERLKGEKTVDLLYKNGYNLHTFLCPSA